VFKNLIYIVFISLFFLQCKGSKKAVDGEVKKEKETEVVTKKYAFDFVEAPLLSDVLAQAKKENKWIYMDVGAKWCVPCQIMKKEVYTHKPTADFFNKNFITYLVDGEKGEGPDLRVIFNINSYPTLLFIDERGREMMKMESGIGATALMDFGKSALLKKGEG
jgi:thioredoxin-related protein